MVTWALRFSICMSDWRSARAKVAPLAAEAALLGSTVGRVTEVPRVTLMPELYFGRVLHCFAFRPTWGGGTHELVYLRWLTDQGDLDGGVRLEDLDDDARAADALDPNATEYVYSAFPSVLPPGSAMRQMAGKPHYDLVPVSSRGWQKLHEGEVPAVRDLGRCDLLEALQFGEQPVRGLLHVDSSAARRRASQ